MKREDKSKSEKKSSLIHGFEDYGTPPYKKRENKKIMKKSWNKILKVVKEMGCPVFHEK